MPSSFVARLSPARCPWVCNGHTDKPGFTRVLYYSFFVVAAMDPDGPDTGNEVHT
jgi:hypothetical protein